MEIIDTSLKDVFLIKPTVYSDDRGYFYESFHHSRYKALGLSCNFIQDNEAKSGKGVLRGLHYQTGPNAQAKLVRVVIGSVYDVIVDLRNDSPTYGEWLGVELSHENKFQLFVPRGFAHGYLVLEDDTIFSYKCDNYYDKDSEGGIRYDDPNLSIEWPSLNLDYIISSKDQVLPYLGDHLI
jgi:dTDP-4-dehydrorhamnose 3,5-epimerase